MKKIIRINKHKKVRKNIFGTFQRPRLAVFRSSAHIYAQIINDTEGKTLAAVSDIKETGTKRERALKTGKKLAEKALKQKISEVVFDRGGFLYKGRVEQLAAGAREGGLKF